MKNQLLDDTKKVEGGRNTKSAPESGSVSGSEIHAALERFLEENQNISLPYGGTEGYWNCFVHQFHQMGFEIKRKQNDLHQREQLTKGQQHEQRD